ncbi:amino acid-binding ACT domain containing protein [Nitzschia inconspicua]|uniref:Amino acid-binding ACT domain containing protein n=1 Tax=Nitzschia inconspicua TaxID=303405 RepID=A0A9K3KVM2_9STRA|nr:amino acid-binding ACT domain containing protein [Nitzschia inconspicua]
MADTIPDAFQKRTLYTDEQIYKFLKFPTAAASTVLQSLSSNSNTVTNTFQAVMVDKDEITVMIPSTQWDQLEKDIGGLEYEVGPISYRLVTFDVVLAPTLVGFMAVVTRALADANISVLPFAAYSRDHIFVSDADFDKTMQVLTCLKDGTIAR